MSDLSPYRNTSLTTPAVPTKVPLWMLVFAWFCSEERGSKHQWYRRGRGGRWTYYHHRKNHWDAWISEWKSVPHCPMDGPSNVYERTETSNWSCHGDKCHCEVW